MKVIFLDIDGVLNSHNYVAASGGRGVIIDPTRMILLKQIVDATGAEIVLSTSWREHWEKDESLCDESGRQINRIFEKYGLKILDKTPKLRIGREIEIEEWMKEQKGIENFVVLDDKILSDRFMMGHFIKTSEYYDGLDEADVRKAIEILGKKEDRK